MPNLVCVGRMLMPEWFTYSALVESAGKNNWKTVEVSIEMSVLHQALGYVQDAVLLANSWFHTSF